MKLYSCWRPPDYQLNGPLFISQDTEKTKAPKLKITTRQIKLPKRLLSGNPNPRWFWNYLLALSPDSASEKVFQSTIQQRSSHPVTWGSAELQCMVHLA